MGRTERLRFEVDPDTSGLWDQVKGDLHRRLSRNQPNGAALRAVSRIYLEVARRDPGSLQRILTDLKLQDGGYST